jgi:hypothetical protein
LVVTVVTGGILLYLVFKTPVPPPLLPKQEIFKCKTVGGGLVPLRVVVANLRGATVFSEPGKNSDSVKPLTLGAVLFLFRNSQGFVEVGSDPASPKTFGWLSEKDVRICKARRALKRRDESRTLSLAEDGKRSWIPVWRHRESIGKFDGDYNDPEIGGTGDPGHRLKPLLVVDEDRTAGVYQVLIPSTTGKEVGGLEEAWTDAVPDVFEFVSYVYKKDVKARLEEFNHIRDQLQAGKHSDHPMVAYLRNLANLQDVLGVSEEQGPGGLAKILGFVPGPSLFEPQDVDKLRDVGILKRRIHRLRVFLEEKSNWEGDWAWIPDEILKGK